MLRQRPNIYEYKWLEAVQSFNVQSHNIPPLNNINEHIVGLVCNTPWRWLRVKLGSLQSGTVSSGFLANVYAALAVYSSDTSLIPTFMLTSIQWFIKANELVAADYFAKELVRLNRQFVEDYLVMIGHNVSPVLGGILQTQLAAQVVLRTPVNDSVPAADPSNERQHLLDSAVYYQETNQVLLRRNAMVSLSKDHHAWITSVIDDPTRSFSVFFLGNMNGVLSEHAQDHGNKCLRLLKAIHFFAIARDEKAAASRANQLVILDRTYVEGYLKNSENMRLFPLLCAELFIKLADRADAENNDERFELRLKAMKYYVLGQCVPAAKSCAMELNTYNRGILEKERAVLLVSDDASLKPYLDILNWALNPEISLRPRCFYDARQLQRFHTQGYVSAKMEQSGQYPATSSQLK